MTETAIEAAKASRTATLHSLQAGRAVAALLVVAFHATGSIFALEKYWGNDPTGGLFDFGAAGVEFFFVLSGFIILHAHWSDIGAPHRLRRYAWKRFVRIYPIYWLVLGSLVPIYFLMPGFGRGTETEAATLLTSFALVPIAGGGKILSVSWTLFHEIAFYVLFAVAILNGRIGALLLTAWFLACAVAFAMGSDTLSYLLSATNLLFVFGMGVAAAYRRGPIPVPLFLAVGGTILFFAIGMAYNLASDAVSAGLYSIGFGLASMAAIAGLTELERQGRLHVPGFLRRIGDASYSLYLIHFPLLSVMAKVVVSGGVADMLPGGVWLVVFVAVCVSAALLCYRFVERPMIDALGRRRQGAMQKAA